MKKYVFGLGSLLLAAVLFAFTPVRQTEKAALDEGYFTLVSGDGSLPGHYQYVSDEAPIDGCENDGQICTILATINDMGSSNPALWKPDFSTGDPVNNEGEFDYITRHN